MGVQIAADCCTKRNLSATERVGRDLLKLYAEVGLADYTTAL
jgi:hypothetical protein